MRILTTDIYEGAYLLSQGMKIEKLWLKSERSGDPATGGNRSNKRSVVFEFTGENADLLRSHYEKGLAQTNVHKLKQAITEIKDCMFNMLRTQNGAEIPPRAERRTNHEYQYTGNR